MALFQKDFRVQELPLARIKKIMKLDEDVKVNRVTAPRQRIRPIMESPFLKALCMDKSQHNMEIMAKIKS